eukprot:gb/GFBE01006711.1/.p1 GENE.gb/GFBE01006711.1/~~gb/GFBE01006711.1/.p1  ORF type:complete len:178 (+),score=31.66 gb/GFBE01006711.1/:1-534(+)
MMGRPVAVLAVIGGFARLAAGAICGNWDASTCESQNDGGCSCFLNTTSRACEKGDDCNGMGITSMPKVWHNISGDGSVVDITIPCMQCRRGFTTTEQQLMDRCTDAGFERAFCDCFHIYCTGVPPTTTTTTTTITTTTSEDTSHGPQVAPSSYLMFLALLASPAANMAEAALNRIWQ